MDNLYRAIFSRNIGLFTESEQDTLRRSTIAIAGVGGVGGLAAERLIRLGVGRLKITDPGDMEESNLNRQLGSSMLNIGQNKAEVAFAQIKDINPQAQILYSNTGIKTENDANLLVKDTDFLIDVMDFGLFRESILLQRAARHRGIYYLFATAIGFGAIAVVFDPQGLTLEEYNGLPLNVDVDDPEKLKVPLERIVPIIPSYAPDMAVIQEIIAGKRYVPTTSIGAGLAAILSASEAINVILKRDVPKAPKYTYFDLVDREMVVGTVS
jgi:molybdopterin/thiamine biosynthesis adenylyltransferase